ncbi:hypothetical protein B7Z17_00555, partial [Candidatus Saccharibacteria bacterium 32-49-10]
MKKDIFWNSIGTAAWSFLSLFLLIVVTRINGLEDSGLFSFAFAFALIMFTVACYGGRAYQVSDHKDSFSTDNYISLRLFTSLAVIVITATFVLLNGYDWQKSAIIFLLVGQRVFDAIADVLYGVLQKKQRLYISGKSLFYKSILSFVVFITIDVITNDLLLSVLSLPIISLLFVLLYDIRQSRAVENFNIKPKSSEIRKILVSTFLPFTVIFMGLIFANLARYFVDIYHPDLQGYFGIIIMPLSLILLLFSFILTPAILHLSNAYNNREVHVLHRTIGKIIGVTAGGSVTACILAYFLSIPLLKLLFGVDFTDYVTEITWVIVIGFALSLISLFTNIAIIARKLRVTAIIHLASNVLLAILCVVLVDPLQIRGAVIAYAIASVTQLAIMATYYLSITRSY